MTLKQAIKSFLSAGPLYSGPISLGQSHDDLPRELVLIDGGNHRQIGPRILRFPSVVLTMRDTDLERLESDSWTVFRALDAVGPIQLAPAYRVPHSAAAGHPVPLGQDAQRRHLRQLTVNFSTTKDQQI